MPSSSESRRPDHTDHDSGALMRKQLRKELSRCINQRMLASFTDFLPIKPHRFPAGDWGYMRTWHGLHEYIVVRIAPQKDQFSIELAWNIVDEFPYRLSLPGDVRDATQALIRLSHLSSGRDNWWSLDDSPSPTHEEIMNGKLRNEKPISDCVRSIPSAVDDCMNDLKLYGMKYFTKVELRKSMVK